MAIAFAAQRLMLVSTCAALAGLEVLLEVTRQDPSPKPQPGPEPESLLTLSPSAYPHPSLTLHDPHTHTHTLTQPHPRYEAVTSLAYGAPFRGCRIA